MNGQLANRPEAAPVSNVRKVFALVDGWHYRQVPWDLMRPHHWTVTDEKRQEPGIR